MKEKTVFILGAGASKESGAPLMNEFLDIARQLHKSNPTGKYAEDCKRVFDAISSLQAVAFKSNLNLYNLESVFGAFEMGKIIGHLLELNPQDIDKLANSMKKVIMMTLEATISYKMEGSQSIHPTPTTSYRQFAGMLSDLSGNHDENCSVITFNYDTALDYALYIEGIPVTYNLGEGSSGGMPLLKLHGSLNWFSCRNDACAKVVPWTFSEYFQKVYFMPGRKEVFIVHSLFAQNSELKCCDKVVSNEPVLVPPTWNKTNYYDVLSRVWNRAAIELSTAENIFIIGYSLPDSDIFFKYLYALGSTGKTLLKRMWVFDIDEGVKKKYEELIGGATLPRFKFVKSSFSDSIEMLHRELRV